MGPARINVDLHLHTWGSFDCTSDPARVLARAAEMGVQRIAITDHNRLDVALEAAAVHPDRIIPGEEVKTAEGVDVIGLFLHEEIPKGTPGLETCRWIKEQGGIVYMPHPYASGKGGSGRWAEEWIEHVDVVEAFNGRIHDQALNDQARALAEAHGLPMGAGSDAHTIWEVARCHVNVPWHPNEPEAFLAALDDGRIHGRSSPHAVHVASTWAKLRKRLPGPWSG
jgi:predicted metal-dependent phosphoesterase TrpH